MHFCAENGQAVKWQPISSCHGCNYRENSRYFAWSINILLYVSSSWGSCSSCWALKPLLPRQMDTQYRQKHMKHTGALESRGKRESCQWLVVPWGSTGQGHARQGLVPLVLLWIPAGLVGSSGLAPPTIGTFVVSRISHQAQPSEGTVCLVTVKSSCVVEVKCGMEAVHESMPFHFCKSFVQ